MRQPPAVYHRPWAWVGPRSEPLLLLNDHRAGGAPGFVADKHLADQLAEVGVILLMLGVGLHFHLTGWDLPA